MANPMNKTANHEGRQSIDALEKNIDRRSLCGYAFAPSRYSLEELAQFAGETDPAKMGEAYGIGEHLEPLLVRIAWWMATADLAVYEAGDLGAGGRAAEVRSALFTTRARFAEALALVPLSWAETCSNGCVDFHASASRALAARYLEFRQDVLKLVAVTMPQEALGRLRDLA
jgi:hypothetical protein